MDVEVEGAAAEVIAEMIEDEVEEEGIGYCSSLFSPDKWELEDPDRFGWAASLMEKGLVVEVEVIERVVVILVL